VPKTVDQRGEWWRARIGALLAVLCGLECLLAGRPSCLAADQSTVMVVVNGAPITDAMVKDVVKSVISSSSTAPSSAEIAQLTDAALESLIDLELLYGAAQAAHVQVSDEDVKREIAKSKARVGGDKAFAEALQRSGLSEAQLFADTRKTMMVDKLIEQQLMYGVRISPEAARRFYDEHQSEFQRNGKVIPYDEAKAAVEKTLLESERRQRQQTYLAELRKNARIERPTPAADNDEPAPAPTQGATGYQ
jgi:hypothetical protein